MRVGWTGIRVPFFFFLFFPYLAGVVCHVGLAHTVFPPLPSTSLTVSLTNWPTAVPLYFSCILPVTFYFCRESLCISAVVSTVFGIIIGPYAIGIFNPLGWEKYDSVTLEFTRIVIAVQVMAAGVSLPRYDIRQERNRMRTFSCNGHFPSSPFLHLHFVVCLPCCGQGTILIPGDGRGGRETRVRIGQCSRAPDKVEGEGSPPPGLPISRLFSSALT